MNPNGYSRESGVEFAVGCFLLALGVGLFIPRKGVGLYSIVHEGGGGYAWAVALLGGACVLIFGSYTLRARFRFGAICFAGLCWAVLAFKFVEASLWGAMLQAVIAIALLNRCALSLLPHLKSTNGHHDAR